jgi:pheromone shutdown protein TraB
MTYAVSFGIIFFFGFAWSLAYFLLVGEDSLYRRDKHMADRIIQVTGRNGYDSVLVCCGGSHRPGIMDYLDSEGWNTDERTTDSYIGKVLIWKDRLVGGLFKYSMSIFS